MAQQQYLINRKLNIVEFANTMKNITKAIEDDRLEGLTEKPSTCPRMVS